MMQIAYLDRVLDLPGAIVLEARRRVLAAPEAERAAVMEELGLCLLLVGEPAFATSGQRLYILHGGLTRTMAANVLDLLPPIPDVFRIAGMVAAAVLAATPYTPPVPIQEPPHWSGLPDPYPGLRVDTGRGPEDWRDFSARSDGGRAPGFEAARATWLQAVTDWQAGRAEGG